MVFGGFVVGFLGCIALLYILILFTYYGYIFNKFYEFSPGGS